jgi:hypothetical protein
MGKATIVECSRCGHKHFFPANSRMKGKVCNGTFEDQRGIMRKCNIHIENPEYTIPEIQLIRKCDLYRPRSHGKQKDIWGRDV